MYILDMCVYIYIYIVIYLSIDIYIYIERDIYIIIYKGLTQDSVECGRLHGRGVEY